MKVDIHPHARSRMDERGATEAQVITTVEDGDRHPAKHGRMRFQQNFSYNRVWRGTKYAVQQVHAIAVQQNGDWLVITVIVKYF